MLDKNNQIIKNRPFLHNCKIITGNISNSTTFKKLNTKFYKVFFLAAQSSTFLCEKSKNDCFKSNFLGIINFYNWALKNKPENIIFTSSMAVYGIKADKVSENEEINPISMYGNSKVLGEKLLSSLSYKKINVIIFRLFNVYGPMQDLDNKNQGMLSIYLSQIKEKNKVIVKGSLKRYRDFVYIDDVIKILNKDFRIFKYKVINVGTGKKTTVGELLNLLFKSLKIKENIKVIASHKGDSFGTYANINKLKELKITPKIDLKKGISKTIRYFYK